MEEEVLAYWNNIHAFELSQEKNQDKPIFNFFDGPPFATGLPHYGHILAGTIKDIVCRYAHQTGHFVPRRFGWDCHGLPIEFEIEKQLGIKSSKDVQAMGIAAYNQECRKIVMRYAAEWERIVSRVGRWIDFKKDYKTMNASYMETVWWVFAQLWQKNLVYKGFKVMPFSTACTTPLSNFEANMNYKDATDPSATVSFPLVDEPGVALLAWTTTPWTLPSNVALVVNPTMGYIRVHDKKLQTDFIFAESRLGDVYKNHEKLADEKKPFVIVSRVKGSDLVHKKYVPLFDYFASKNKKFFRVLADSYVTSDSGTGVVHSAPGFGEDDYRVCAANGLIKKGETVCPVDENGHFTADVTDFAGRYIKDCDDDILANLKTRKRLFQKASIVHSYPFCWRSETPLIYKAVSSWFVRVEDLKEQLLAANASTSWVPDFVKTRRFSNWLEDARDWNVSRNRYWGTPLPVWTSEDGQETVCIGSIQELEERSGVQNITDLHREFVDQITIPSQKPGHAPLRRVTEVFDCWFESGAMPYAQAHYPFEQKEEFLSRFPADFIAEGLDQTRGWFYTLLVLSTALFNKAPFRNLIVNGLILASDGKKMSKRLGNYPEVMTVVDKHGADALRLYLINSPVVRAEPLRFREEGVRDVVRDVFLPLLNACKFFITNAGLYVNGDSKETPLVPQVVGENEMDRWIAAAGKTLVNFVHAEMKAYRLYTVVPGLLKFLDVLTNWYVRMNRRRLKGRDDPVERHASLSTLLGVLYTVCRILAPFCPFVSEVIFQQIRPLLPKDVGNELSVHFLPVPAIESHTESETILEAAVGRMITVIDLVRKLRDRMGISMKMPVRSVVILHADSSFIEDLRALEHYIKDEVNTFEVIFSSQENEYVVTKLDAIMSTMGKRFGREGGAIRKALAEASGDEIQGFLQQGVIMVLGHELTTAEVRVERTFRPGIEGYESNSDGQVVVLVDKRRDESLINAWKAREFVHRIMQLRKAEGMSVTDKVVIVAVTNDEELRNSIEACRDQVKASVQDPWVFAEEVGCNDTVVASKETSIGESALKIYFTKVSQ